MKRKMFIATMISCIVLSGKAYAQEPVISLKYGQTVVEDMIWPSKNQAEEAQEFLSDNNVEVPEDIAELCDYYGNKNNIAPELLEAIIFKESRFLPRVTDSTGNYKGLMQISPSIHSGRMKRLGVINIFDPASNIAVGSDYLKELLENNPLEISIMLYNGDRKAYEENYLSEYAKEVLRVSEALERVKYK